VIALSGALGIAAYSPISRVILTVRLLAALGRVAASDIGPDSEIRETRITRRLEGTELAAVTYERPGAAPARAIILVPGISELGFRHPRLVSLARALAGTGFLVLTPDIRRFREFRICPPPIDEISFWLRDLRRAGAGAGTRHVILAGVSFSGTLSLIAAAQPRNQGAAAAVLGIGAFDDLLRCSRGWFGAGPVTVGEGHYPTRFYAKWVVMLAAVDMLTEAGDRAFLEMVLRALLGQREVPVPPDALSDEGRRWYRLALIREDRTDAALAGDIEARVAARLYPALAIRNAAAQIACPVFLAHGAYDDLIPPEESARLQEKITSAPSYLLVSPFLTHTHPRENAISWWAQTRGAVDLFLFLYRLTGVL